jgi:diguanylate cyclase (GGDEF)-like protein
MPLPRTLAGFSSIRLRTDRDVTFFVARTTALCVAFALLFDVLNQLIFFESWGAAIRSWCITVAVVVAIATPVSRTIGKAYLALFRASQTDSLTGLLNRAGLLENIEAADTLMALIIVDVDRFKLVNDTYGHLVGDQVLRTVAGMMSQRLGKLGRVGRLGGEEFAVLATQPDREALLSELEEFRDDIARTPVIAGAAIVTITISAGVADRREGESFEQLFTRADKALYRAKAAGRNRVIHADQNGGPAWSQTVGEQPLREMTGDRRYRR